MCVDRGVGCICVRPCDVAAAAKFVAGSPVAVASVIGFPHGSHRPETKALEARLALADGARELDMVMNIGRLLSGDHTAVRDDIAAVVGEAKPRSGLVKVILETCFLSPGQIATASLLAEQAGADFVKTSTGYGTDGATPEAVRIMLDTVGGRLGVKASGGIRTWNDAVMYLDMGCTRLGVGDAARILDGA
jgi:deoxyribose-phosphate aldolase